ncbi:uncharacterized protein LOC113136962 [Mastacembelus armatus]|uniref:uncharacterized protein LOC113136962 n=1 Tax=Mastacembelus armatus TaxID=205130 RepID=UPI000E45D6E8|nr:uncharacterized protein LOC113136962 [Mastacembelus armatus]
MESGNTAAVELVGLGQIQSEAKSKPDRLSVTENCSLVLKKVTVEDVGRYTCRQFDTSGRKQGPDSEVDLSVVTMTEQKLHDNVTFSCQVFRHDHCYQSVKWVYQDKEVNSTSQRSCSDTVTFPTSDVDQDSKFYESLKCKVTDPFSGKVQQFIFSPQSSGEETGEDGTTTTVKKHPSGKSEKSNNTLRNKSHATKPRGEDATTATPYVTTTIKINTTNNNNPAQQPGFPHLLRNIVVCVGLSALIMCVVTVNMWTRTKGNKTQKEQNTVRDDEDDEGTVTYDKVGEPSVSVRLH